MEYRQFGRTGMRVSPLCFGCLTLGRYMSEDESIRLVDAAIDHGVNFFDNANVYGPKICEEVLGKALLQNKKRDWLVLASKFHFPMNDDNPNASGNHRRHIIRQVEGSLKRLGTDHLDLYQVHRPMSGIPIDETLRALDDLVRQGKVRYIGTSTFAAWQIVEALWCSHALGLNRFVSEQPPYNLLDRRVERELLPMARTHGIAIMAWSPLARGFLSGKYSRGEEPSQGRFQKMTDRDKEHLVEPAFRVLDAVQELAAEKGCTPAQLSLAWLVNQPGVTCGIMGVTTMEQLEDNLKALDVAITGDDRRRFDEVSPPGRAIVPYYEGDFGPHLHRWLG